MKRSKIIVGFMMLLFLFLPFLKAVTLKEDDLPQWAKQLRYYIDLALKRNRSLNSQNCEVKANFFKLKSAKKGRAFHLEVSASHTKMSPAPSFDIMGRKVEISPSNISIGKIQLVQPIYVGGKISLGIKLSDLNYKISKFKREREKEAIVYQVTTTFFRILRLKSLLNVIEESIKTLKAHEKVVESLYENGVVLETDLLEVKVRLSQVEEEKVSLENNLRIVKMYLWDLLAYGLERHDKFNLISWQKYLRKNLILPTLKKEREFISYFEKITINNRKELKELSYLKKLYYYQEKLALSDLKPQLSLVAEHHTGTQFDEDEDGELYLAQFKWEFADGNKSRTDAKSYFWKGKSVFYQIDDLKSKLKIKTRQDIYNIITSIKKIKIARLSYRAASKNLSIYQSRYQQGIAKNTDLLEAELNLTKAKNDFFNALYDYIEGLATLYYDAGVIYLRYKHETPAELEEFQNYLEREFKKK